MNYNELPTEERRAVAAAALPNLPLDLAIDGSTCTYQRALRRMRDHYEKSHINVRYASSNGLCWSLKEGNPELKGYDHPLHLWIASLLGSDLRTLENWLHDTQGLSLSHMDWEGKDRITQTRLAWADWMIAQYDNWEASPTTANP